MVSSPIRSTDIRAPAHKRASRPLIVVGGPTASGKSALALRIAESFGGVVINADSMQVYRELRILTARPSAADEARAPHRLYGILPVRELCSAGRWRDLAVEAVAAAWAAGAVPVVVGGTGLYLRALREGLSPIPDVPPACREAARALLAEIGNEAFHTRLGERDPVMVARLHPGNSQRLVRAWEVLDATGRSLADWQAVPASGGVDAAVLSLVLTPPRQELYAACDARFLRMMEEGALDEVAAVDALGLDPALPALKALGMPALRALLRGAIRHEEAVAEAQQATRNYAKRQLTWFRHQLPAAHHMEAKFSESLWRETFPIIRQFLLTNES